VIKDAQGLLVLFPIGTIDQSIEEQRSRTRNRLRICHGSLVFCHAAPQRLRKTCLSAAASPPRC